MSTAESTSTHRETLPKGMAREIQMQMGSLSRVDLRAYTYEHIKSSFKDAKSDLTVFDNSGKLVLRGRDFHDRTFFWSATYVDPRLVAN